MADTIKHLIRQFREIERPFLEPGSDGIADWGKHERQRRKRRTDSVSPYYEHAAYGSPTADKGDSARPRVRSRQRRKSQHEDGAEDDDAETFWAQRAHYKRFGISCRFAWLKRKSQAQDLFATLSRVQIRRVARQVGGLSVLAHEYGSMTERTETMLRRLEDRMMNIVGVRRIE